MCYLAKLQELLSTKTRQNMRGSCTQLVTVQQQDFLQALHVTESHVLQSISAPTTPPMLLLLYTYCYYMPHVEHVVI